MITPDQALTQLRAGTDRFGTRLATTDLAASVPACPDWTARDLVVHLGDVHRWVVQLINTGNTDDPTPEAPDDDALCAWYRGTAGALIDLLAATDPGHPVWTFGSRPRTAAFWSRRQAHEVGVHLWDLGAAAGEDAGYDDELAMDGIDEVVTVFFPRQVRLARMPPLSTSLALAPDDHPERWVLSGDGTATGPEPAGGTALAAEATVAGPAAAILLLLWGRVHLSDARLRLIGSHPAATAVLRSAIVP